MTNKNITVSGKAGISRSMGPHVKQVVPSVVNDVDPFVFVDHFGPFEKRPGKGGGVPPHPHAGIATVTYLYSGSNLHDDSAGNSQKIYPGDLAWMNAGRGIVHAEGLGDPDAAATEIIHGLQIWISLPAKDKFSEPGFQYYQAADLPVINGDDYTIKVLCGRLDAAVSPVTPLSPAYLYDVQAQAGAAVTVPIPAGYTCGLYVVEGTVEVNGRSFGAHQMIRFEEAGDAVSFTASAHARIMLLGGQPLNESIVAYASFVMNSMEQVQQVINDYHAGKMGVVAGWEE